MKVVLRLAAAVAVAVAMLGGGLGLTMVGAGNLAEGVELGPPPEVELRPMARRSVVLAADGSPIATLYEEDRVPATLEEIPDVLEQAVIAVEDAAFYSHEGVSVRGVLRALRENARAGGIDQGGSTITQQLVKNAVLDSDRTYDRKAREAVLAMRLEDEMSKEEILQRYLNTVYFGQGAYGVRTAVERYFGKPMAEVTVAEAALLAGVISSPQSYDPFARPDAAQARRQHALDRMVTEGYLDAEQAAAAAQAPLPETAHFVSSAPDDYFGEEVRRQLLADPRLGATYEERFDTVFRGGIAVHTTLDPRLQALAEQAVREKLPPSEFTAALVAVDPADGSVRALVGGPNFDQAKFNLATQGFRQAGSSFKTIALAAWLDAGHHPDDLVDMTAPCEFPLPPPADPPTWRVDNYDGGSRGGVGPLREATVKSMNCAYARLALALGPEKLVEMAKRLGVSRELPVVPSIVLGAAEMTPLEMASMYATLAAGGVRHTPTFIRKVVGHDGTVLFENAPQGEQVIPAHVAHAVTDVLRGVVAGGTGRAADIGRPAAGKTGTAQEWRDAWFLGFTPQLATAVWMGHPAGQVSMYDVGGRRVTGGSYPAQIWGAFMGPAHAPLPVVDFPAPDWSRLPPPGTVGMVAPPPAPPPPPPPAAAAPPPEVRDSDGGAASPADRPKRKPREDD